MKPISLEMQAFGPFVEKQYIDFEKLSRDDIFLIKGKTGSGKTTIFDAMTFACTAAEAAREKRERPAEMILKSGAARRRHRMWSPMFLSFLKSRDVSTDSQESSSPKE